MLQSLASGILKRGAELAFSLALVITSFLAILVVGTLVLPEGQHLRALVRERGSYGGSDAGDAARELRLFGSEARHAEVARLERAERKVKSKAANHIAWSDARAGMSLGERHSIQTFDRSSASIAFDEANRIELAENSLVVLRSYDRNEDGSDRRATLLVSGGEVRGRIHSPATGAVGIDLELPRGRAKFRADGKKGGTAEFRVEVNEGEEASRVSVYSGEAEITSGNEKVKVGTRQSVRIDAGGRFDRPVDLPSPPRPLRPGDETITFRNQPPPVTFAWESVPGVESYVLRIASDASFREVVFWTETSGSTFEYAALKDGLYWWRLSAVVDGLEGAPGESRRLRMHADREPPELRVDWPTEIVRREWVEIRGRTEPGSHAFAANEPVTVDANGSFAHRVSLQRGATVVVIEAVDAVGNTAYESHVVNAEY